jgi:hypothetical protein
MIAPAGASCCAWFISRAACPGRASAWLPERLLACMNQSKTFAMRSGANIRSRNAHTLVVFGLSFFSFVPCTCGGQFSFFTLFMSLVFIQFIFKGCCEIFTTSTRTKALYPGAPLACEYRVIFHDHTHAGGLLCYGWGASWLGWGWSCGKGWGASGCEGVTCEGIRCPRVKKPLISSQNPNGWGWA